MARTISPSTVKSKLMGRDPVTVLDVREIHEYRAGHIEGAKLIPLDTLAHRTHELKRDDEILVICRSGNRSTEAAQILEQRGFYNVWSVEGGYEAL